MEAERLLGRSGPCSAAATALECADGAGGGSFGGGYRAGGRGISAFAGEMELGFRSSRDDTSTLEALIARGFSLGGVAGPGPAEELCRSFVRLLPSALAARRDFSVLTDALMVGLAATFDALAGYYSRRGPFEGQVFCCAGLHETPYVEAVGRVHATSMRAFEQLSERALEEFEAGLPFRLDDQGRTATFVWFDEQRSGAFVLGRRLEPFSREALAAAAVCTAVAAEVIGLGADVVRLERETRHDFLTGLLNRSFFETALPSEIERASRFGSHFSLVFMDLDGFKRFNDSFGHRRGDDFLRKLGTSLAQSLRRADTAMRYGGDEFAIVLPNTTPDQVATTLGRVRESIECIARQLGADTIVGASFGVAHYPTDGTSPEELVAKADSRLYHAKDRLRRGASGSEKGDAPRGLEQT